MNFDIMQIFGLRILSILLSCLDTLLYFVDSYDIISYLLRCQKESQVDGKIVIDDASIERNRILVRSTVLGGYTEKVIPPRLTMETMSHDYPFTLFDKENLPTCYLISPSPDPKDEVKLSAMMMTETSSDSWLDKTRSFVLAACRKPSFTGHVGLMEVVLKYQLQESPVTFPPIKLEESGRLEADTVKISGLEYGCQLIVEYGVRLNLLPPTTEPQALQQLCLEVARALCAQQHSKPEKLKFDWFACVVYLLFGGQSARIRHFLTTFSTTLTSGYLWNTRLLNSTNIKHEIASSGLTVVHYNACHCVERVLQKTLPKVACAFRISGMSPSHLVKRWMTSCFLNILPWNEIANYVLIVVSEGPVFQVLYCVALLKHLETRLLHHSTQHTLLYDTLEEPVQGFVLSNYLDYMLSLDREHGTMLRKDLADINISCVGDR